MCWRGSTEQRVTWLLYPQHLLVERKHCDQIVMEMERAIQTGDEHNKEKYSRWMKANKLRNWFGWGVQERLPRGNDTFRVLV